MVPAPIATRGPSATQRSGWDAPHPDPLHKLLPSTPEEPTASCLVALPADVAEGRRAPCVDGARALLGGSPRGTAGSGSSIPLLSFQASGRRVRSCGVRPNASPGTLRERQSQSIERDRSLLSELRAHRERWHSDRTLPRRETRDGTPREEHLLRELRRPACARRSAAPPLSARRGEKTESRRGGDVEDLPQGDPLAMRRSASRPPSPLRCRRLTSLIRLISLAPRI